jgi:hypothetical protein
LLAIFGQNVGLLLGKKKESAQPGGRQYNADWVRIGLVTIKQAVRFAFK